MTDLMHTRLMYVLRKYVCITCYCTHARESVFFRFHYCYTLLLLLSNPANPTWCQKRDTNQYSDDYLFNSFATSQCFPFR